MTTSGRSGYADLATLLRMVVDEPDTSTGLGERFGIGANKVGFTMAAMLGAGLVLVREWRQGAPVWGFDGSGAPLASLTDEAGRGRHIGRFCTLMVALMQGVPVAPPTLQQASGIDADVLRDLLHRLCEVNRLAFVADWHLPKRRGCGWVPHYLFGIDRESVPHPRVERAMRKQPRRKAFAELLFTTAGRQWPSCSTTNEERTS